MILDRKKISEVLAAYSDLTKISTMYFEDISHKKPVINSGLDPLSLMDCFEASEVLKKIRKIRDKHQSSKRRFMTYITENRVVYNIHFIKEAPSFILAGPLVKTALDPMIMSSLLKTNIHSIYQKQSLLQYIRDLPPVDENYIIISGNMMEILLANDSIPIQFQEHAGADDLFFSVSSLPAASRIMAIHLYANLLHILKNNEASRIYEISEKYTPLFMEIDGHSSNHRMLKDFFLVMIALVGWNLLDRGANQIRIFNFFHQSILSLEKELLFSEIIRCFCDTFITLEKMKPEYHHLSMSVSIYTKQVLNFLELHYNEKITLKQLADKMKISPEYLSSLLKKDTGMGIAKNINRIRIEKSKDMLRNTNKSILEIANDLGYKYQSHFTYVFKKQEAITPMEFKNRYRNQTS